MISFAFPILDLCHNFGTYSHSQYINAFLQFLKIGPSIILTELGISTFLRLIQSLNTLDSISKTVLKIIISSSDEHPLNKDEYNFSIFEFLSVASSSSKSILVREEKLLKI